MSRPIYLDYQATTPLDRRVLDAMMPFLTEKFGNPHSVSHIYGWESEAAVEAARGQMAALIGAEARDIIFTSGATESNNLAIKGAARALRGRRDHVVTVATEHKCVLESVRRLEREGFQTTILPVRPNGLLDLDLLADIVTDRTALVSVMAVNNEIGVIQPLAEIGAICRARGALFHCDAAQAIGKIPLNVEDIQAGLLSVSGHKIYGPKGIGALYVRRKVRLDPLLDGGGQERGLRPGTLAPAQCVGLGAACAIATAEGVADTARIADMARRLRGRLQQEVAGVHLNGDDARRFWGNLNFSFDGVDGARLLAELKGLAVSPGAACASASGEPSYVLAALGLPDNLVKSALRIGIGRFTTDDEISRAGDMLIAALRKVRN